MTLTMSSPVQRRAWELIQSIPKGKRTQEICEMLCRGSDNSVTLGEIRTVIREELRRVSITTTNSEQPGEAEKEEIADEFLDFLSSLHTGGDNG